MRTALRLLVALTAVAMLVSTSIRGAEKKAPEPTRTPATSTSTENPAPSNANDLRTYSGVTAVAPLTGEQINWQVIASGGGSSSSASYNLNGTIGQTAVGAISSSSYILNQGYWQTFGGGSCCTLRGDVDNSGGINIADLTYLVQYIFQGGPAASCGEHADVDGSGGVNIADLTYLVQYIFQGGPEPTAC